MDALVIGPHSLDSAEVRKEVPRDKDNGRASVTRVLSARTAVFSLS